MTRALLTREALKLPAVDQLELAQAPWERASPPGELDLSPELRSLLEERRREALADPRAGVSWEEARARLLKLA